MCKFKFGGQDFHFLLEKKSYNKHSFLVSLDHLESLKKLEDISDNLEVNYKDILINSNKENIIYENTMIEFIYENVSSFDRFIEVKFKKNVKVKVRREVKLKSLLK